jgi:hypothetical protein
MSKKRRSAEALTAERKAREGRRDAPFAALSPFSRTATPDALA